MNNKSQQKRALPPTPSTSTKYINVSDAIQSLLDTSYEGLSDRERRWHNDLSNCQKTLEQKEVKQYISVYASKLTNLPLFKKSLL